jgi:hypothetical protein
MKRQRDVTPLVKAVGGAIKEHVGKAFRSLSERISALERGAGAQSTDALLALADRVEALEQQQKSLQYCGTWESGRKYAKGNFVTDGGSVWHCDRETTQRPGPGDAWTLAVKRGRDA